MSYALDFAIILGSTKTGLALQAQLVDSTGSSVGPPITTGFTEIGRGNYLWHSTAIPESHRGGVVFTCPTDASAMTFTTINPQIDEGLVQLNSDAFDVIQIEPGVNARQALSIVSAVLAGILQQVCPGQVTISAINNPGTTRLVAQTAGGNRYSVTLNLP